MDYYNAFVGLDVHKETISVAVAEAGRNGEVRHLGVFTNAPEIIAKFARKLVGRYGRVEFAYEAGPCGYGIYRQLTKLGFACRIVAPSTIPKRRGDRIKNDTRDAVTLARLLRAVGLPPPSIDQAGAKVGPARHVRDDRARRESRRNDRPLLLDTPAPSPLDPRDDIDPRHRLVSCTAANTVACTGATSPHVAEDGPPRMVTPILPASTDRNEGANAAIETRGPPVIANGPSHRR